MQFPILSLCTNFIPNLMYKSHSYSYVQHPFLFLYTYILHSCTLLIYTSGGIARGSAYFGQGNSSIFLDNVQCTGNKASIFSCYCNRIGSHHCNHSEDAGVVCITANTVSHHK